MASESGEANETVSVTSALARLKREGSNLLVVGTTSDAVHTAVCDRLLGDLAATRHRAFVATEQGGCVPTIPSDADTVVRYQRTTRSAAATTSGGSTRLGVTTDSLADLGSAVADTVETADRDADGLDPAQFRLCFDSLYPLLEEYPERELFRFLHAVTNEVRSVSGMAHYHLPISYEAEAVRTLAPLFDAVIEIRSRPDGTQQRWHLRRVDETTEWLPL